jgi:GTP cyclohydrolase I
MNDTSSRTSVLISIGSNIDRERNLPEAIRLLRRDRDIDVMEVSRFFESAAVGGPDDAPPFYNAAVLAGTSLEPEALRDSLRRIERVLGRVRTADRNAPRTIDLDIAYYGTDIAEFDEWSLPDPDVIVAPHVAIPIADVAPEWTHPKTGELAYDIAARLDGSSVRPVATLALAAPHLPKGTVDWDDHVGVYAPRFEALIREQLLEIGEDPDREGLLRTPLRVAKAMDYLTSGYATSLEEVVNEAVFDAEGAEEMVVVKDIEFYSMCEHHMLPFFGSAAVAYLPDQKIVGLSKLARIVDLYARRLQVQERMTNQIADAVADILAPHGVAVVVEGQHFCMMMRGVQKQGSSTVTSAMLGTFKDDARTRMELLELLRS